MRALQEGEPGLQLMPVGKIGAAGGKVVTGSSSLFRDWALHVSDSSGASNIGTFG